MCPGWATTPHPLAGRLSFMVLHAIQEVTMLLWVLTLHDPPGWVWAAAGADQTVPAGGGDFVSLEALVLALASLKLLASIAFVWLFHSGDVLRNAKFVPGVKPVTPPTPQGGGASDAASAPAVSAKAARGRNGSTRRVAAGGRSANGSRASSSGAGASSSTNGSAAGEAKAAVKPAAGRGAATSREGRSTTQPGNRTSSGSRSDRLAGRDVVVQANPVGAVSIELADVNVERKPEAGHRGDSGGH